MNIVIRRLSTIALLMCFAIAPAFAAGKLEIRDAWIRSAPPNATMLAGYATLHNSGDAPITINAATAQGFDDTSLHETVLIGDVSQMRPIGDLVIAPGASVSFAPGGKHIMMMQPTHSPKPGDHVAITFISADGGDQPADFVIGDGPAQSVEKTVEHEHQQ